ncbi:TPA: cell division protein FtsA [Candidatus Gracilibacteria bacterium]|nr:cell division protein FtsA [Candidatus Peregrinibacteria bacterium]HIQ56821.1 cell division protein FtsA [Candidatus Gracilibacteria bacterium]HIQ57327.1 cell division protein FtsA [Candidatus Gracilibacteria bacterium]
MAREQVVASLDIGNSKVRCVISVISPDQKEPHVVGIGEAESLGIRDGMVSSIEEVVSNINTAVENAERMSGLAVHHVYLGTSGSHIETTPSRGVIAVSHQEISDADIQRVIEAAQNAPIGRNAHILRIIPRTFAIDDQSDIQNPLGMSGIRLEVDAHVITGNVSILKNLEKSAYQASIDVNDIIPAPLASAEAVLTRRQKELGVVAIDIGSSSTSVTVYEEGSLVHTAIVPIGGASVTKDIAIGLRTSIDAAERLKIGYGTNIVNEVLEDEEIDLEKISKIDSHIVSRKHLSEIIQARYYEILMLVKEELKLVGRDGVLPGGATLSGGGSKMAGTLELSREVLSIPVQVGYPQGVQGMVDQINDPSYATAVGLILWGVHNDNKELRSDVSFDFTAIAKMIGDFFKKLLP